MKILFFDGYCSLCNTFVDQLIKWDVRRQLKFASLQGQTAKELSLATDGDPETVIYFKDGLRLEKSTAVLAALADLGGAWRVSAILKIVPRFVRDFIYRKVAKNRYRIFGKRDTCRLPTPEEQERFLP